MKYFIFLIILSIFLVACVAEQEQQAVSVSETQEVKEVPSKDQQVEDLIAKKKTESDPQEFTLPPAPAVPDDELFTQQVPANQPETFQTLQQKTPEYNVNIEAKAQEVLNTADLKTKSFSYVYREPPYNSGSDRYVIKGDKIRILLGENGVNLANGISDIFLNTKTKQAVGYCIPRDSFLCENNQNKKFLLEYNNVYIKTNYEWMKEIISAQYKGSEQMEGRAVAVLHATLRGQPVDWVEVRFYIEKFYGLPMRIDIVQSNGKTISYNFDKMDTNSYEEEFVTPPAGY